MLPSALHDTHTYNRLLVRATHLSVDAPKTQKTQKPAVSTSLPSFYFLNRSLAEV